MGWRDKSKKRTSKPEIISGKVFVIHGIEVSLDKPHVNDASSIAEITIKGGDDEQRYILSNAILAKISKDYDYDLSTDEPDDDTLSMCFRTAQQRTLMHPSDIRGSGKPAPTYDVFCAAVARIEEQFKSRMLK